MRLEVLCDVGGHLGHAVRGLDEHLNAGCLFGEFRAIRFGELVFPCQLLKRDIDSVLIEVHFRQARLKVQRQRGSVALGVLETVSGEIPGFVAGVSKPLEGVVVALVDGRAGEAEEECVRQCGAHGAA